MDKYVTTITLLNDIAYKSLNVTLVDLVII